MPNFSEETIEGWRAERVLETDVPDLNPGQPQMMRRTINEDLAEERRRLAEAVTQIDTSRAAIKALLQKSKTLQQRYGV